MRLVPKDVDSKLYCLLTCERGDDVAEFALIVSLVAIGSVALLSTFSSEVQSMLSQVINSYP
jgi:Flp pilus assembly pilin Flp